MKDSARTIAALKAGQLEADGKPLTANQQRELDWLKEQWFLETAKHLPKKLYRDLTGLADSQTDRAEHIYQIPTKGTLLNLSKILIAFHEFLAEHGRKIKQVQDTRTAKEQAEQRMLEIKIRKAELELAERANKLIDRELVKQQLQWLANQFSEMAEEIGRTHGPKPQESINEFLKKMERELESADQL